MQDLMATAIEEHTLVGVYGTPPHARGNCFGVRGDDGKHYKVVNFVYENLEALLAAGLTFPIQIRALSDRHAVVHDKRIPHGWYPSHFCEVCCPRVLLPLPQALRQEREVMQGVREERNGLVMIHFREPKCLVKPNVI
jgi:hypothetical protein